MGPRADRTVDVLGAPTRAAHQVMVVVAGAALESSGMARRLDPAHQSRAVQAASTS